MTSGNFTDTELFLRRGLNCLRLVAAKLLAMSSGLLFKNQEALKRLRCSSCLNLLNDPVQPSCGHRLCKSCADETIKEFYPPYCPHKDCREEFTIEDGVYVSLNYYE